MKTLNHLSMILLTLFLSATLLAAQPQSQSAKTFFPVEKDGKWGFIDRTGKIVIPLQFDGANEFHEGLALVTAGGKRLFIDTTGHVVITPQFDIVNNFCEGLAAVNIGQTKIPNLGLIANPGKWGYIDQTGKLVIPLKFEHAEDFSEGLAPVKVKVETVWCPADTSGNRSGASMMYGYVDKTGKMIF